MLQQITANELHSKLLNAHLEREVGEIVFRLSTTEVKINSTDTVGNSIQSWLGQYMTDNDIYHREPKSTQVFPDFFLRADSDMEGMLEVKCFNYNNTPAFDIANFESYCDSVKDKPYRLDADYLIFGYTMNDSGDITIQKVWLKKIWQIAGKSSNYPLKTQVKRGMIYNIRPEGNFKNGTQSTFRNDADFVRAIYGTLRLYKNQQFADNWLKTLQQNYQAYFKKSLII